MRQAVAAAPQSHSTEETTMETIDAKDVEQARSARTEIMTAAAVLLSTVTDPDANDCETVLDQAVKLYKGATARIKVKKPDAAAA